MTEITHHIPTEMIQAYAAGHLSHCFSLVVAAHVTHCDHCRAQLAAEEAAGGAVLDLLPGAASTTPAGMPAAAPGADPVRAAVLGALDAPVPSPASDDAAPCPSGVYPGAVMAALKGRAPRWRPLGGGIRQQILFADAEGSARLLWIPPGEAVPDHGHNGIELTMVLQGSFEDETGQFGVGDVEVAAEDLDHTPVAGPGAPCICLAATDAPLRFNALLPRLLQPLFRI